MLRQLQPTLFDKIQTSISVTPEDGIPHITDLPNDLITRLGEPYMRRYFLLGTPQSSPCARYHQILQSDPQDFHDHPWDFISVIIDGTYIETTPTSEQEFTPGSVLIRTAEQLHRLTIPNGPVWTFVTTGKVRRTWGFNTPNGWQPFHAYLAPRTEISQPTSDRAPPSA